MLNIRKFFIGLGILPVSSTGIDSKGELEVLSSDGALYYHDGSVVSKVITAANATSSISGQISVSSGGTGASTLTVHGVVLGQGTSAMTATSAGTAGQALLSGGASADPAYGTLSIGAGGTGQVTKAAAFDALSPMTTLGDTIYGGASGTGTRLAGNTTTTKKFLQETGDGVNAAAPSWATIDAIDVPTLNQNTTGTAANVTGTVAIANGGTGQITQQLALNALAGAVTSTLFLRGDGTNVSMSAIQAGDVPTLNQNTTGTASNVTGVVAITNGGTGQTTKAAAFDALSPMTTAGDIIYGGVSGTGTRLPKGDDGQALILTSGSPSWSAIPSGALNLVTLDTSFLPNKSTNANFELTIGDWLAYADAAATSPVDMTGGSPNTTLTRSTSSPMDGLAHALMTVSAGASRQGEGVSCVVNIPPAYRGQSLNLTFPFITTGALVEDDFKIYVYDITNSVVITPYVSGKILGINGLAKATFSVAANTVSIRIGIHIARTSTAAATITFDDVMLTPYTVTQGVAGSEWTAYTPTFTGFGTVSTQSFWWRRNGDSVEISGKFTAGTSTATEARISLPSGLVSDSSKIPAIRATGTYFRNSGGSPTEFPGGPLLIESGVSYFTFSYNVWGTGSGVSSNWASKTNGSTICGANDVLGVSSVIIPISGWSSNVTMAESSTFNISSFLANGSRVTATPTALGQYRSYLRNAGAFTFTETNGNPTSPPTAADGVKIYQGNTFASADTNNSPTKYEIFVGKNKNIKLNWYKSPGRTGFIDTDPNNDQNNSLNIGYLTNYDPTAGILTVVAQRKNGTGFSHVSGVDSDGASNISGAYFDIVVSENAMAVGTQQPRSEITVDSGNGHGSTNTKIRRFSNTRKSVGIAITYADSASLGGTFTINETGVYAVTYNDSNSAAVGSIGITVNDTAPTSGFPLTYAQGGRAISNTSGAGYRGLASWTGNLNAGDIVYAHDDGTMDGADSRTMFTITKVSN